MAVLKATLRKLVKRIHLRRLCRSVSTVSGDGISCRSPSVLVLKLDSDLLPVLCMGTHGASKGYTIALHRLRNPRALLQMMADTASGVSPAGVLTLACEPPTFEAIFCLLQRSSDGLTHTPLHALKSNSP